MSTCAMCLQTATEHYMCERLVVDDIVHWAKHYKVQCSEHTGLAQQTAFPQPDLV